MSVRRVNPRWKFSAEDPSFYLLLGYPKEHPGENVDESETKGTRY